MITKSFRIKEKVNLAKDTYSLLIDCEEVAKRASQGQFVQVSLPGFTLPRPISICEIFKDSIRIVFDIRGKGTKKLAELKAGESINLIAPLGNGFSQPKQDEKVVLVGGGIGVPPLLEVAKRSKQVHVILGFKTASSVILKKDFENVASTTVCTDDGSMGFNGFVTQALEKQIEKEKPDKIMACGPKPMLKGIASLAKEKGIACELSLEERMACGVGACLVCQCKTIKNGEEFSSHVCTDGPVFDAGEVVL